MAYDVKSLRSYLGLATFFRRFVQGFLSLTASLTSLLCKDVPLNWSPECDKAISDFKEKLTSAPVLAVPTLGQPFQVWCDASGFSIGAVLLQNGSTDLSQRGKSIIDVRKETRV